MDLRNLSKNLKKEVVTCHGLKNRENTKGQNILLLLLKKSLIYFFSIYALTLWTAQGTCWC